MGRPKGSTNKRTQTAQQDMQQQAMTEIAKRDYAEPVTDTTAAAMTEVARLQAERDAVTAEKLSYKPMSIQQRAELLRLAHEMKIPALAILSQSNPVASYDDAKKEIARLLSLHRQKLVESGKAPSIQPQTLPQKSAQGAIAIRLSELRAIRDVTDLDMPDEEEDRFNEEIWKTGTIAGLPVRFNSFVGNYTTSNEKTYSRFSFYYLDDESDMEEHFFHLFNQNLASKIVACFDANDDEPFATTLKKIPLANGHTMWQMQRATF